MSSQKEKLAQVVLMPRGHWDVPLRVDVRRYLQFSESLDEQLQELVGKYAMKPAFGAAFGLLRGATPDRRIG